LRSQNECATYEVYFLLRHAQNRYVQRRSSSRGFPHFSIYKIHAKFAFTHQSLFLQAFEDTGFVFSHFTGVFGGDIVLQRTMVFVLYILVVLLPPCEKTNTYHSSSRTYLGLSSSILLMKSAFSRHPSHPSSQSLKIFFRSRTFSFFKSTVLKSICLS